MIFTKADVFQIIRIYPHFQCLYPNNTVRKNYFIATCFHLDKTLDIDFVNSDCPYGGLIGIGDSNLKRLFSGFKLFRLHAVLHDACGYMKDKFDVGPGYMYSLCSSSTNSCFFGHLTGLTFCSYLKWFKQDL